MLGIDKFFFKAISGSEEIAAIVGENIFNPARDQADEDEDKIPYIILWFDGASSDYDTKDNNVMRPLERGTVKVLVCAEDADAVSDLAELVQSAVEDAFNNPDFYEDTWNFEIDDCDPDIDSMQKDQTKPCCFLEITYKCQTSKR